MHFFFKLPVIPAPGSRSRCEKLRSVMHSKTNPDQRRAKYGLCQTSALRVTTFRCYVDII